MIEMKQARNFRKVFGNKHVVLPVIHVDDELQANKNAEIASREGVDGVFLINHSMDSSSLLQIHATVTHCFPDLWVGVNCLDLSPAEVFARI